MQRHLLIGLVAATASFAAVARAQNSSTSAPVVVKPTQPAPAVVSTAPSATTPVVIQTPTPMNPNSGSAPGAPTQPGVTQVVHTPQLPNPGDLTNAAAAQGLTVERIVQTTNQVIAFYRNASGQTSTVAYQALPPTGTAQNSSPAVVVTAPPPTVVYRPAPRVVYYDSYPDYYYPRYWYPPVSLSFGIGYGHGHFHGGHRHRR